MSNNAVQQVLAQLDREIEHSDFYKIAREQHIDSIKQQRQQFPCKSKEWFDLTMQIAKGYNCFYNDSAIAYYTEGLNRALEVGVDSIITDFRSRRATYLTVSGYVYDALNEIALVDTIDMTIGEKRIYYTSLRQMYYYISDFYVNNVELYDSWIKKALDAQEKLLHYLPHTSVEYQLNISEYLYANREYAKSQQILLQLINSVDHDTPTYAIACHILSTIATIQHNPNESLYYLALSAIADIRTGTMEVTSIQDLGGALFTLGDSHRAHNYLIAAMNNAVESNAAVRLSKTADLLTVIENDHIAQIEQWRRLTRIANIVLFIALVALIIAIYFMRRQLTRTAQIKENLEISNRTKDVYMTQFLTLCSLYMDKLKQFGKLANRKISAGQVDELYALTKSGKFVEEQSREFYVMFDEAFLHIYPSFVTNVNKLLRHDEQIELAKGEHLNTDLRILAFMRLGIDDTNQVAQILNYSVNTIYAYRNKLRNRAINRETFEADIMAIGTV
jgi:tetratricopeptide (TPR) repeat protein